VNSTGLRYRFSTMKRKKMKGKEIHILSELRGIGKLFILLLAALAKFLYCLLRWGFAQGPNSRGGSRAG